MRQGLTNEQMRQRFEVYSGEDEERQFGVGPNALAFLNTDERTYNRFGPPMWTDQEGREFRPAGPEGEYIYKLRKPTTGHPMPQSKPLVLTPTEANKDKRIITLVVLENLSDISTATGKVVCK